MYLYVWSPIDSYTNDFIIIYIFSTKIFLCKSKQKSIRLNSKTCNWPHKSVPFSVSTQYFVPYVQCSRRCTCWWDILRANARKLDWTWVFVHQEPVACRWYCPRPCGYETETEFPQSVAEMPEFHSKLAKQAAHNMAASASLSECSVWVWVLVCRY